MCIIYESTIPLLQGEYRISMSFNVIILVSFTIFRPMTLYHVTIVICFPIDQERKEKEIKIKYKDSSIQ